MLPETLCVLRLQSSTPTILCSQLIAFIGLIGKLAHSVLSERRCTMQHNAVCSQSARSTMPITEHCPRGKGRPERRTYTRSLFQILTPYAWFCMFNTSTWIQPSELVNKNKPLVNSWIRVCTQDDRCVLLHAAHKFSNLWGGSSDFPRESGIRLPSYSQTVHKTASLRTQRDREAEREWLFLNIEENCMHLCRRIEVRTV